MWRPWYATLWAETAVLADDAGAGERLLRARWATADNPIADAIMARAAALATGTATAYWRPPMPCERRAADTSGRGRWSRQAGRNGSAAPPFSPTWAPPGTDRALIGR